jgi:thymidylate synthase (FAD)
MRLIKNQEVNILAISGEDNLSYSHLNNSKLIERVGRVCYKSEQKIEELSYIDFCKMLESKNHMAMFEHSWEARIYKLHKNDFYRLIDKSEKHINIHQIYYNENEEMYTLIITGNIRAFRELGKELFAPSFCDLMDNEMIAEIEAEEFCRPDLLSMTVHFITNRGISHELVRHRKCSFAQESTRYCNYNNSRFGKHCTFLIPSWATNIPEGEYNGIDELMHKINLLTEAEMQWLALVSQSEMSYSKLLENGAFPEQARDVLPNCLKTEIVVTANLKEWQHIINLRYLETTGRVHFQMKELMRNLVSQLDKFETTKKHLKWD